MHADRIRQVAAQLKRRCPDLLTEIEELTRAALGERQVQYVEVTRADGSVEVMTADAYRRLSATDLAHTKLRMVDR